MLRQIFDRIVDQSLLIRRLNVVANHVIPKDSAPKKTDSLEQLDLFTDYAAQKGSAGTGTAGVGARAKNAGDYAGHQEEVRKERDFEKGMNLEDGATAKERNQQIGGHKA